MVPLQIFNAFLGTFSQHDIGGTGAPVLWLGTVKSQHFIHLLQPVVGAAFKQCGFFPVLPSPVRDQCTAYVVLQTILNKEVDLLSRLFNRQAVQVEPLIDKIVAHPQVFEDAVLNATALERQHIPRFYRRNIRF